MDTRKVNAPLIFYSILFLLIAFSENYYAQNNLSITTSIQMIGGNYADSVAHNRSYYLYGGIRYQAQDFSLSLTIPVVTTSGQAYTQIGGMYIPNNNNNNGLGNQMHGSVSSNSMMNGGSSSMSSYSYGIGDTYLNGSYNLYNGNEELPIITLDGYIKFPTATTSLNIGTGKLDYNVGIGIKKFINEFLIYGQLGYLILGKDAGSNLINPITLSFGAGKVFGSGKHSIMASYDYYSEIIAGVSSPKQLSLGYSYIINPTISYTVIGSLGLSNSTSDYSLSGGISFNI